MLLISGGVFAQSQAAITPDNLTMSDCIKFALDNQPIVQQSKMGEEINSLNIKLALSDWLPQINSEANLQHYFQLPVAVVPNTGDPTGPKVTVATGTYNNSGILFSANQVIYNSDVLLAGLSAKYYRHQATENTENIKIDLVVNVSKAFYDVVISEVQLRLIDEELQRLDRNLKDAFSLYQSGLNDKIDFKRATIALNTAKIEKRDNEAAIKSKTAYLKQLMSYPPEKELHVVYDSLTMTKDILLDTMQLLVPDNRIEYRQLQTHLKLQKFNTDYYKMAFLPTISAFADYDLSFQYDNFSSLYAQNYPNSYIGLKVTLPIFQGTRRFHNIKKAKLEYDILARDTIQLNNEFNREYTQALAEYKSSIEGLDATQQNVGIAHDVYDLVKMQYQKGIKTYLDVLVSETDLRTAEINRLNAIFRVLSGKLDVQKALGSIQINY
jgi:outer membrane protein